MSCELALAAADIEDGHQPLVHKAPCDAFMHVGAERVQSMHRAREPEAVGIPVVVGRDRPGRESSGTREALLRSKVPRWISRCGRISSAYDPGDADELAGQAMTRWSDPDGIGSLMAALDTLVVSTALSTIRLDLGASVEELEWTVNAYNLSFAVLLITGAALGDRYGRRRMFAAGLGLFTAASAACALAPDVGWLIAARRRPGRRRGAGDARSAGAAERRLPAEKRGGRRSASSARSPGWRSPAVRWSAARSSRASPGSGSSGSTCRSGWSRSRSCSPG